MTSEDKSTLRQPLSEPAVLPNGKNAIEAEISKIAPNLPPEKRRLVALAAMEIVVQHSGPLPPPQILAGYDQVLPGLADRIMGMAENELKHQQDMQRRALEGEISERKTGQIGGTVVAIVALVISAWVAVSGYQVVGGLLAGVTLLGIVTTLIGGREWLIAKANTLHQSSNQPSLPPSKKKRK